MNDLKHDQDNQDDDYTKMMTREGIGTKINLLLLRLWACLVFKLRCSCLQAQVGKVGGAMLVW